MSYVNSYTRRITPWSFEEARGIEVVTDPVAIKIHNKLESISLPFSMRREAFRLAYYAAKTGVKIEEAINNAIRYLLEYEFPEDYPSYHHLLHNRGKLFKKCLQIWREKGLIKELKGLNERYLLLIKSENFRKTLLNIYPSSYEVERIINKLKNQVKRISSGNLRDVIIKALREVDETGIVSKAFEVLIK